MSSIFASGSSFLIPEFEINEAGGYTTDNSDGPLISMEDELESPPWSPSGFTHDTMERVIEWKNALEKLEKIPNNEVLEKLKISYDDLIDTRKHEVFMSFRGEDTRASFTSHLYASLCNAGITVFKDDESLPRGDHISDSLLLGIEQSLIAVVIFSRNYAESGWCMKELEKIMKCHRTIGQVVVPVFYDVDPSEVRHQRGDFGNGFQKLSNRTLKEYDKAVMEWKKQLRENGVTERNIEIMSSSILTGENNNNLTEEKKGALGTVQTEKSKVSEALDEVYNFQWKKKAVEGWREALQEAAGISGFVVLNSRNENEAIGNIVENVIRLLDKTELFIADNPVGIESRVQDIIQWLDNIPPNAVALLGLWGMGGIGKTTLAKAIYNKIRHNFEGKSFLADIRDDWGRDGGPARLQQQLLSDINKEEKTKIQNVESGTNILKERLRHKKVLLILDDVNKLHQLKALCGGPEWFGSGSRIIITTRDMNILRGRVDKLYQMKGMNESESIELFSWHAFKEASPKEDFAELSKNVIKYSGGLPLALEVLGSYLYDMEVIEWKNALEKLKKVPNDEVQEKLKISYDGLSDDTEKEIFLDIACFFIGMNRKDVIHILNGSGLCAENGIRVLIERSLVTVDDNNKLGMHDLLRDMGREIIRAQSPKGLEERSRLWLHEDALDVLLKEIGTKATEGLALKLPRTETKRLSTKAFKQMKKLRLLQLSGVELVGDFEHLSKDLKWLCWHEFPLTWIPTNFYQGSLVSIELENSKIKLLWKEAQMMEKLKILNLSHSHYLTQTPDFMNLPNLEKLILIDCSRLSEVSHTIGHLNKVLEINLQDCISLHNLPRSIYKLKSLKTLILSGCLKIDKLEEDIEQMESLTTLVADKTAITTVPFSIVRSKSIGYISLCGYEGFSRDVFPSIIWSWISPINSLSSNVQTFVDMSSLVPLDVQNSNSHHPSDILKDLSKLRTLCIECGSELQLSQDVANILDALYATNYKEMESAENASQIPNTKTFTLIECNSQVHISGSKNSLRSLLIQMGMSCQVSHTLKQIILQNMATSDGGDSLLPGDSYPDWLTFNNEGSSVIFEIPQVNGCILKTMMCHVHYSSPDNITSDGLKNLLLINHTKTTIQLHKRDTFASFEDEEWHRLVSNIEPGNKLEVVVVFGKGLIVKKTTVYLMYEPMDETTEHCHAANKNVMVSSDDENDCAVRSTSPQECNKFGLSGHKRGRDDEHSNVQCQICNKIGHIASNCYHRFDPNYVAESNFQFQNQFPDHHAVVQPIFPPSQSGSLPDQQQFHSSYMPPKQVQPLQQAFQVPYTQHSQFQTVSSASVPPMSFPQAYMTNSGLSQAPTQQYQNWLQSGTSHFVTSNPTNLVQAEPVQGQEHVFLGNAQGFPIQYHFHPNAQSNFQCQNHFPHQHAVMQPIFPPFQGSLLSHQQEDHFSHMRPTQGQPLQQAHQISYPQHSQFQTVSSASVTPTSFPDSYITNSGLSLAPTQQSHNGFINSGTLHHVTSNPTNLEQAEPVQGEDHGFPDDAQG